MDSFLSYGMSKKRIFVRCTIKKL